MLTMDELLHEIDQLAVAEKWLLVKRVLTSLEQTQQARATDYQQFLRETYGSLRDSPIKRWDQGDYEAREDLA